MDKKQIIKKVVLDNLFEQNDEELRRKVAYEIRNELEQNDVDYTAVNLYTPPEMVDKNEVRIAIDNEVWIVRPSTLNDLGEFEINIDYDSSN